MAVFSREPGSTRRFASRRNQGPPGALTATGWDPRPTGAADGDGHGEWLSVLDIPAPERQRRWTVLLRWLLLCGPQP
ncbi:hypothetical protein AB0H77_39055 [Streptomyces sp. NPDC050844]|uniref:hypothetical protein n=1 Tax=Streptomyces sp. NPDC050844 TaxID=3155790 RepID=UPI0033F1080C